MTAWRTVAVAVAGIVAILVLNLVGAREGLDSRQISQASDAIMWCVGFVGLKSAAQHVSAAGASSLKSIAEQALPRLVPDPPTEEEAIPVAGRPETRAGRVAR